MDTDAVRHSWAVDAAATRTAGVGAQAAPSEADKAKVVGLAREFESYFVLQMLRQMREAMLDDEEKDGLGAGTMIDTMDGELARQLTETGGIGLTGIVKNAIERQVLGQPAAAVAAAAGATEPLGAGAGGVVTPLEAQRPEPAMALPVEGRISSPFGYRADPFTGMGRFHAGVDIAAAYGREVPSAGDGRVVFAGEQGGYGNTVVVEHDGGVRTRYAHLSSVQVRVGDGVEAGSVVGRVGSSGRSTGPHLHFEVLQDGRPVNPAVAATRYAGLLKLNGVAADLSISQPSGLGVAVGVDDEDSGQ